METERAPGGVGAFGRAILTICAGLSLALIAPPRARADTIFIPPLNLLILQNVTADGSVHLGADGLSFILTGGNTGSGVNGETDFSGVAGSSGTLSFNWAYSSLDQPGYDAAGYILGTNKVQLSDSNGQSGMVSITLQTGETYGWWVTTADNQGEPGILSVNINGAQVTQTPEPAYTILLAAGFGIVLILQRKSRRTAAAIAFAMVSAGAMDAQQSQNAYVPTSVTGQFTLARVVNPSQIAASVSATQSSEIGRGLTAQLRGRLIDSKEIPRLPFGMPRPLLLKDVLAGPVQRDVAADLTVAPSSSVFGFEGLSHYDQRNADSGNQLSLEPPNPSLAIGNGFIVEGVNNAVGVYDTTGKALLPPLSSDQWFGLGTEYDRSTGTYGVDPTDMRVYFDSDINRFFVLQRAQDEDSAGNPLNTSHLYVAVSATSNPTGAWNIYVMDTTHASNSGCPCVADYPTIGSDQYGIYITADEYDTATNQQKVDAIVLAISKTQIAAGATAPSAYEFTLQFITGYEFAIHPAVTPPGASKFIASGGVEYFVSTQEFLAVDNHLSIWAMSDTASLGSTSASLLLTQTLVSIELYSYPGTATQRSGPLPYGSSLSPPGQLELLGGDLDSRVQSVSYAGGRLYVTTPCQVSDVNQNILAGGAYMVLSPTYRNGILGANVLKQGYLAITNNHLLLPAIAVNASGEGAIVFTVSGPDYYPSAAFVSFDLNNGPGAVQIAAAGAGPEDGFTGYCANPPASCSPDAPVARWGDYSTAQAAADGSIWMVTEYIPGGPRTTVANWGTYVAQYVP